jgi:hypothetical protein
MNRLLAPLLALSLLAACAGIPTADLHAVEAQGVFVRHARIRVAPPQTKDFEALIGRCTEAVAEADLEHHYRWLCYREPPGRYWLIWFSHTADGFSYADEPDVLSGFLRGLSAAVGDHALVGVEEQLARIDHEIEWNVLHRQKQGWSTVDDLNEETHPIARMIVRTVVPGAEEAFDRALTARTDFLREQVYPMPVEGFVTLDGAAGTALQVSFGVDWPSFHARDSFGAWAESLDEETRAEYARLKAALLATMSRAEYYHGKAVPELTPGN